MVGKAELIIFVFIVFLTITVAILSSKGVERLFVPNYRGKRVFLAGFFLTFASAVTVILLTQSRDVRLTAVAAFLVGVCGLVDDIYGGAEKGFRGHMKSLFKGRVTTGMFKLISISLISLFTAFKIEKELPSQFLAAIILASASNLFNLLDLRPGRSVKFALPAFIAGTFVLEGELREFAFLLAVVYLVYLLFDLKEFAMLGDAGANPLGFFAATIVVFAVKITLYEFLIALVLVGLNLVSEKVSFTKIIERNKILNFVDRLGRVRMEQGGSNGKKS